MKMPVFGAREQQNEHLTMIDDSRAEIRLVCPTHKHRMTNVTKLQEPLQLETAGGDVSLDTVGDLICGGVVCRGCLCNPMLSVSLFSLPEKGQILLCEVS